VLGILDITASNGFSFHTSTLAHSCKWVQNSTYVSFLICIHTQLRTQLFPNSVTWCIHTDSRDHSPIEAHLWMFSQCLAYSRIHEQANVKFRDLDSDGIFAVIAVALLSVGLSRSMNKFETETTTRARAMRTAHTIRSAIFFQMQVEKR